MNEPIKINQSSVRAQFVKRLGLAGCLVLAALACLALLVPGPIQQQAYMGAEYCGSCHQEEYRSWAQTKHAKAFVNIKPKSQSDASCLTCHATGFLSTEQKFLPSVQCESCHGPGQYYAASHIKKDHDLSKLLFMKRPAIDSCRHCHLKDSNLWNQNEALKRLGHGHRGSLLESSLMDGVYPHAVSGADGTGN